MEPMTVEWVRLARRDIGSARTVLLAGDPENALYLVQQALEKALRALIQDRTASDPPYTHRLAPLAEAAGVWDEMSEADKDLLDDADPYVVVSRYGATTASRLSIPTAEDAEAVLTRAEEVLECLLAGLK
jgi:HEPN domain-containing protein